MPKVKANYVNVITIAKDENHKIFVLSFLRQNPNVNLYNCKLINFKVMFYVFPVLTDQFIANMD